MLLELQAESLKVPANSRSRELRMLSCVQRKEPETRSGCQTSGGARHHQAAQNEVWTGLIPAFKVRAHGADGDFNCFSEAGLLLMKFFSHSKMILEELIKTLVVGFISALQV